MTFGAQRLFLYFWCVRYTPILYRWSVHAMLGVLNRNRKRDSDEVSEETADNWMRVNEQNTTLHESGSNETTAAQTRRSSKNRDDSSSTRITPKSVRNATGIQSSTNPSTHETSIDYSTYEKRTSTTKEITSKESLLEETNSLSSSTSMHHEISMRIVRNEPSTTVQNEIASSHETIELIVSPSTVKHDEMQSSSLKSL